MEKGLAQQERFVKLFTISCGSGLCKYTNAMWQPSNRNASVKRTLEMSVALLVCVMLKLIVPWCQ